MSFQSWSSCLVLALVFLSNFVPGAIRIVCGRGLTACQDTPTGESVDDSESPRKSSLVRVQLPIDHLSSQAVLQELQRLIDRAPPAVRPEDRPVVVLKFDTDRGATGAGSSLADCLEIAQLLTGPDANRVKTVAYVPAVLDRFKDSPRPGPTCQLVGHAVLVAIAAEDLVIAAGGEIGDASLDQPRVDPLLLDIYRNIASARLTMPVGLVNSMVDPNVGLFAVSTDKGELIVDRTELDQLERDGKAIQSETLSTPGKTARFSAAQLDRFSPNVHSVSDLQQLAVRYGIDPSTLVIDGDSQKKWVAVQYSLPEYIDRRSVDFGVRAIETALGEDEANLVIVVNGARGGDLDACLKLASYLADFDSEKVRTVVYVPQSVSGAATVVALAADHLLLPAEGTIGGPYEPLIANDEIEDAAAEIARIAELAGRDSALFMVGLDPNFKLGRWRHNQTGQMRLLTDLEKESLADAQDWRLLGPADMSAGLTGQQAEQDGVARGLLASVDELGGFYQLESPAKQLTPTRIDRMLESFARFLARPLMAGLLLFGAMFLLSTEMSTPGVGVPGFLGTICLVLFFWSQYLDGNADWLEIILFVVGVGFILMELFLFPGTIVLGVGGLIMVVAAIVLATQTFLIPRNSRELAQLPVSLGMVCAALGGVLVALFLLRKYLPSAPIFKRMMLEPPVATPFGNEVQPPEEFNVRVGQRGLAISRLVPSGKARIGNKFVDVITDGIIVDPRTEIEVVEVSGNRVLVKPIEK